MEQYEQLFKAVSQIVQQAKVAKEESRLRGEQFNIFKVCGVDHYELQHSKIIAELLNPEGSHGQGCLYLKLFMETYGSSIDVANLDEKSIRVKREEWTTDYDGRMDIYVEYQGKPIVIIENKIFAGDQGAQLKKYRKDAIQRGSVQSEIIYLTLWGDDASPDSGEGIDYIRMSYSEHIIKWMELCIEKSSQLPLVRETLVQYRNHIKQLTQQDMNEQSKNELFEIMVKKHEEVDAIINAAINAANDGYFAYLFNNYVKPDLQRFASDNGLDYIDGLFFTNKDWNGAKIGIDTQHVGCNCGIVYDGEKEIQNNIWGNNSNWWPFGCFHGGLFHYWGEQMLFSKIINKDFSIEVINLVTKMLDDVKKANVDLTIPIRYKA